MKHLLAMRNREVKAPKPKRKYARKNNLDRSKLICCKIAGFWWALNHRMWADHMKISRGTISYRSREGKPVEQILDLVKCERKKRRS